MATPTGDSDFVSVAYELTQPVVGDCNKPKCYRVMRPIQLKKQPYTSVIRIRTEFDNPFVTTGILTADPIATVRASSILKGLVEIRVQGSMETTATVFIRIEEGECEREW